MTATPKLEARLAKLAQGRDELARPAYARRFGALAKHLDAARGQAAPAMALHTGGARAVLFQLEALTRMHVRTLDEARFAPVQAAVKALEDSLGAVDFADALLRKLGPKADPGLHAFFAGRRAEACAQLEHHLAGSGWWAEPGAVAPAMASALDAVQAAAWPKAGGERRRTGEYLARSAERLHERLADGEFDYHNLEAGVHEVRRRVRWLSILPACFEGLFVRPDAPPGKNALAWYAKPEVLASPFNSFPPRDGVTDPLELDSGAFLALSWLIAEIGGWKDRAQVGEAIAHAWREQGVDERAAAARTRELLGDAMVTPAVVARAVQAAVGRFVKDKVLQRLARTVRK